MESGNIIRVKHKGDYFTCSNEPMNDRTISWEASGLMGYLLSKPDNWEVRESALVKQRRAGKYVVHRIIKELQAAGYIRRYQYRKPDGTFTTVTEIYESPRLNPDFQEPAAPQKLDSGTAPQFTGSGSTDSGKPVDIIKTDLSNPESIKTERESETKKSAKPLFIDTPTPRPPVNLAYKVYTEETGNGAHASKVAIKAMERVTDLDLWRKVVNRWILCGWKEGNIKGMLDYYDRGELPGDKPKESAPPGPTLSPDKLAAYERLQQESMQ